jgi:hypothetical protein
VAAARCRGEYSSVDVDKFRRQTSFFAHNDPLKFRNNLRDTPRTAKAEAMPAAYCHVSHFAGSFIPVPSFADDRALCSLSLLIQECSTEFESDTIASCPMCRGTFIEEIGSIQQERLDQQQQRVERRAEAQRMGARAGVPPFPISAFLASFGLIPPIGGGGGKFE